MNKIEWLKKYSGLLLVIVLSIAFYRLFDSIGLIMVEVKKVLTVFTPVFIGAVLAYFLSPATIAVENKLDTTSFHKNKRVLSVLIVFFTFLACIVLLITVISPSIANAVMEVASTLQAYVFDFEKNVKEAIAIPEIQEIVLQLDVVIYDILDKLAAIDPLTYIESLFSAASTISTWVLGIVFCPYILVERDRLKKIFDNIALLIISPEQLEFIHEYAYRSHRIFGNFVYGKFIDSLIIGMIAAVGFWIMGLPAVPLLAITIGVTNMIPYFGPFIGAIPIVLFVALMGDVMTVVWLCIFIFALQQFDGYILGPAILGETVGISAFWVIFAVTIFGGIWGLVGMFIGVPLIVILRAMYRDFLIYKKSKAKEQSD